MQVTDSSTHFFSFVSDTFQQVVKNFTGQNRDVIQKISQESFSYLTSSLLVKSFDDPNVAQLISGTGYALLGFGLIRKSRIQIPTQLFWQVKTNKAAATVAEDSPKKQVNKTYLALGVLIMTYGAYQLLDLTGIFDQNEKQKMGNFLPLPDEPSCYYSERIPSIANPRKFQSESIEVIFEKAQKCPSVQALVKTVKEEGPFNVLEVNSNLLPFAAGRWFIDSRVVLVREELPSAYKLRVLIFELMNASQNTDYKNLTHFAERGLMSCEAYTEGMERLEFKVVPKMSKLFLECIKTNNWPLKLLEGFVNQTFEEFWQTTGKNTAHADKFRDYWQKHYVSAYSQNYPEQEMDCQFSTENTEIKKQKDEL